VEVPEVLFRDGLMLIVNKPPGVPVHAGPSGGPSLEDTFDALRFGLPRPPALAHRLDQDTSGCLVLGRHPKALRRLGKLFSEGRVGKTYWAVTRGRPASDRGRIDFPLLKTSSAKKGWRMVVDQSGKDAVTDYRVLGTGDGLAWIEFSPRTGRTHQIRVHCAQAGFPILGDPWYGVPADRESGAPPLHLHARAVRLPLYKNKAPIEVEAPIPSILAEPFKVLGADQFNANAFS
jgi:tRNA pseudouridine32 synthase/23S rRNA pseudouridine746 synthase